MKIKKLFLIFTALLAVSFNFVSCFNVMEENPFIGLPEEPVNTGASGFTGPSQVKYATLQGSISFSGAVPSQLLAVINNENSGRTAMPQASSNWYYVLYATATGKTSPTPTVYPISSTSYSITGLETSASGVSWTVTVRVLEAASAEAAKNISATTAEASAILSAYCQITLTDDNSVYVHDFIVKPVTGSGKNGTLNLTMTVPESVTNVTVDSYTSAITINTPATPNPPTGAPKTVTITGTLASDSYSIRFNFYGTNNLLLYSNRQTINVFNNCETNTWVNNGGTGNSDPISSGSYTVTDTMITNFQSNIFYVGATIFTEDLAKKTGTRAEGYTGTPVKPFTSIVDAVSVIKDRNNSTADYTILITGSVLGTQVVGDSSTSSYYYIDGKAASIRIVGATGLDDSGVPQDELNLSDNATGTILSVKTSVPVTIESLKITGGKRQYDRGGGIYINSGATVKLGNGALITGNVAQYGAGIYNAGSLFMYGSARVGDTTTTPVTAESIDSAANHAPSSGPTDVRGGGVYNSGTVYLGYDGFTTDDPPQKHQCTLTGGITRNYPCGLYNIGGTVYFDSGDISYNYGTQGGGVYLTNSAKLIMTGGSITNNMAKEYGGGVQISGGGEFDFQKGTFTSNTLDATNGQKGGAVCNYSGTFKLGKETSIASTGVKNNDIGLYSSQKITVDNTLDQTSFTLDITTTSRGTQVLTGDKVADVYTKFALNNVYGMGLNNQGKIDLDVIVTDIYVNKNATADNSFTPAAGSYTKNDSTWNNSTYAFNASATSSQSKPFKSIDTALKFITYQASEQDYTIHIVGTYTVASSTEINITNNSSSTDPIKLVKTATQTNPTVTAKSITIEGVTDATNPPKISGANTYRCLSIATEVPVIISNISIINGYFNGNSYGAGITIDTLNGPRKSDVTLSTGAIINSNSGTRAGAIYNFGTLTIVGAEISDNSATDTSYGRGGAIRNEGGIVNIYGATTIIGAAGDDTTGYAQNETTPTKKYSNYAGKFGGAIFNDLCSYNGNTYYGEINIGKDAENNYSSPKIEYNYSGDYGGGIYNCSNCIINFYGGSVSYCAATNYGGGIYNEGKLSLKQAARSKTIKTNYALSGGAVYENGANASFTFTPYTSNAAYISIPCSDSGINSTNTIYLGRKSATEPCQITITGLLQYGCDYMRISTNFSTYKGKTIIKTSDDYTPSLNDYNISLSKFGIKQPSGSKYSYFYSSEKLTTDPEICQTSCNYPTLLSNITNTSVGDIVMIDGDIIKYEAGLKLGTKASDAVAIIFHNGTGLGAGTRVLGMAADLSTLENYNWANSNPASDIPALAANVSGTNFSGSGTRFSDGSSNYSYASTNSPDTIFEAMRYCANYKNYKANLGGTTYESGWYLPSIRELYKVYENITTISAVFTNALGRSMEAYTYLGGQSGLGGANGVRYVPYWSSNTEEYAGSGNLKIWSVYLGNIKDGDTRITAHVYNYNSPDGGIVLPIRQFN